MLIFDFLHSFQTLSCDFTCFYPVQTNVMGTETLFLLFFNTKDAASMLSVDPYVVRGHDFLRNGSTRGDTDDMNVTKGLEDEGDGPPFRGGPLSDVGAFAKGSLGTLEMSLLTQEHPPRPMQVSTMQRLAKKYKKPSKPPNARPLLLKGPHMPPP